MSFSPPLADILAADTSHLSMVEIGIAIIELYVCTFWKGG
jgi:hypothetical protein